MTSSYLVVKLPHNFRTYIFVLICSAPSKLSTMPTLKVQVILKCLKSYFRNDFGRHWQEIMVAKDGSGKSGKSSKVFSLVQFVLSRIRLKWGWVLDNPVSKMATRTPAPVTPRSHRISACKKRSKNFYILLYFHLGKCLVLLF